MHVPLREVRDAEGNTPDFAQVNEIQIVFEWADMAGTLELQSLRLLSVWAEQTDVAPAAVGLAAGLQVPAGFVVEALADDLPTVTQIEFTPQGDMLASLRRGAFAPRRGRRRIYGSRRSMPRFTGGGVGGPSTGRCGSADAGGSPTLDTTMTRGGCANRGWTVALGPPPNNGLAWNPDLTPSRASRAA